MLDDQEDLMRLVLRMPPEERTAIAVQAMAKTMFEDLDIDQWDEYWGMVTEHVQQSIAFVMQASMFDTGEETKH